MDEEEMVPLSRYICTECGDAYHSDEEKATICNRCLLGLPHRGIPVGWEM